MVVVVGTCCWNLFGLLELVWVVLGCKPKLCNEAEVEVEAELVCLCVGLGLICWAAQERKKKPLGGKAQGGKAARLRHATQPCACPKCVLARYVYELNKL